MNLATFEERSPVRVLVHERHVLVGEARHRAGHADAADVRAAAHVALPAAQRDVALHHRALAAELDQAAVVVAVLRREVARLVERRAVAALVRGAPEQRRPAGPRRRARAPAPCPASANTRCTSVSVMLSGCAGQPGMFTIGMPALDFQFQPEVVAHAHRAGRVVLHRRDAAVRRARPDRDDRRGLVGEPVDPLVDGDGLAVGGVDPEAGPVAVAVDLLVARASPR